MCFHCFEALIQNLRLSFPQLSNHMIANPVTMQNTNGKPPPFWNDLPNQRTQCPLFVTWEKQQQRRSMAATRFFSSMSHPHQKPTPPGTYELRGCIGSLSPMPVATGLTKYALMSGLRDQRFTPIHPSEVPHLRVAVSLLVQYEECQHVYDWQVGTHGIVIKFSVEKQPHQHSLAPSFQSNSNLQQQYSATYLPEVAKEQGWDQATAVASLIRKAGYTKDITEALLQRIHCTRYQSSKLKMTFEEYLHMNGSIQHQENLPTPFSSSSTTTSAEPITSYAYKPAAQHSSHNNCNIL